MGTGGSDHSLVSLRETFSEEGVCLVSKENLVLATDQWVTLNYKAEHLFYQKKTDKKSTPHSFSSAPIKEGQKMGGAEAIIFDVVTSLQIQRLVRDILAFPHFKVQQCECHIFEEGDFISLEWMKQFIKDAPYLLTFGLNSPYQGGEHVFHQKKNAKKRYQPKSEDILLSSCAFSHEILPIIGGKKRTVLASINPL